MANRPLVTLTTDFGLADPYAAAMKGVILRHCPDAEIVDISHQVPSHQVLSGAYILANAAPFFPPNTVHVVVVDPGVGTDRAILVGQFGDQLYVFPDNGIITFVKEAYPLRNLVEVRELGLLGVEEVASTFHGRDIFAPLVGYIFSGKPISRLGMMPDSYTLLDLPEPRGQEGEINGQVIHVDHFGNLITNITRKHMLQRWENLTQAGLEVYCQGRHVGPLQSTYGQVEPGRPLALMNSMGMLELAVNLGRFRDSFDAGFGADVSVRLSGEGQ
ncbi:MAG: SAM-dependent chlorinase/fluorinase [Phycisphaerae bacterium]|nr:SAM-dependent chlorinase/fluorinase [Phycisphaerae bacterium]